MTLYHACRALHFGALFLWLGHMFFWSLVAGPALKRIDPPATAARLRNLSLRMGGLGWPALVTLLATGAYMLEARGGLARLVSPAFLASRAGTALVAKLALVAGMLVYQAAVGHRPAPRAIYLNMLAALAIVGLSVIVARG